MSDVIPRDAPIGSLWCDVYGHKYELVAKHDDLSVLRTPSSWHVSYVVLVTNHLYNYQRDDGRWCGTDPGDPARPGIIGPYEVTAKELEDYYV